MSMLAVVDLYCLLDQSLTLKPHLFGCSPGRQYICACAEMPDVPARAEAQHSQAANNK